MDTTQCLNPDCGSDDAYLEWSDENEAHYVCPHCGYEWTEKYNEEE
ncbi:MAG TPA: hypothetical protein VFJ43_06625 [Bacteroidia bacterium]|nr:hypothetical protein [Bacteroidia bacterium]